MFHIHTNTYQNNQKQSLMYYTEVFPEDCIDDPFNGYYNDHYRKGKRRRKLRKETKYSADKKILKSKLMHKVTHKISFQINDEEKEQRTNIECFNCSTVPNLNTFEYSSNKSLENYDCDSSSDNMIDIFVPDICDQCCKLKSHCICSENEYSIGFFNWDTLCSSLSDLSDDSD